MSNASGHPVLFSHKERHVLRHSTGWESRTPLYRNHFCAGESHDDWGTIQALCARGLMRVGRQPGPLSGGDTVFVVTEAGIAALRADAKLLGELGLDWVVVR